MGLAVDAIRADRFLVATHAHVAEDGKARFARLAAELTYSG
jgi:hypothetical protein